MMESTAETTVGGVAPVHLPPPDLHHLTTAANDAKSADEIPHHEEHLDSFPNLKTFTPRTTKPAPMLRTLKNATNFRHSSFFETATVNKEKDEEGHKRLNHILYGVIGQGAFGKVRKAYWPERDKYYAVKIINKKHVKKLSRATRGPKGDGLDTIRKEFAIWKRLEHPNIVRLKEVIDAPSKPMTQSEKMYMVSELIDGGCIVDGESTCTPLLEDQAKNFFCQLIEGIDFLHFHKIIHRDIKPSNLLAGADGVLKITDFGMSHVRPPMPTPASSSRQVFEDENEDFRQTVGTGPFLAPEMLSGGKFKGIPVDIWACGVTLYMLAFGCLPFQGSTLPDLYDKIQNQPVACPEEYANGDPVNPDLIDLVHRVLTKNPDDRLTAEQIRRHRWTKPMFRRVSTVEKLEAIALTPEAMAAAVTPVTLYERLHKKIKALAMVNSMLGHHALHIVQSSRSITDHTLPILTAPVEKSFNSIHEAKEHFANEVAPTAPPNKRGSISMPQTSSPRRASIKKSDTSPAETTLTPTKSKDSLLPHQPSEPTTPGHEIASVSTEAVTAAVSTVVAATPLLETAPVP
ncbi:Aste57867_12945 [Aphanomyces stellatus]|uniref:Aste57867_12945 protein n=1 Tax=Aphanomyces stellatus TaxID=120398 RepID=A0A485KXK5_9STRA|nr:hypothetical protein As57867_012897 [Aphanomyces stellatus]VFT89791.1 Aste57867_12945 [Aphanomyces stellatus]